MHVDNSGCNLAKNAQKVKCKQGMKGCGMEGRLVLLPFVEGGSQKKSSMNDASRNPCKPSHHSTQERCIVYPDFLHLHRPRREPVSKVRMNSAMLKRAVTERRTRLSGTDWKSNPKSHWRSSPVEGAGQSSHEK